MTGDPRQLRDGQRVGEYVLDAPLGRGTFGEVWRAHHHAWTDQFVAVKVPNDPQYLRSLENEGAAIRHLVHPNIVRPIGFDPYADVPYLITEYVDGKSLRQVIDEHGQLTPDDAVAVLRQVLAGLRHAHDAGVVHRDVKPANVLIEACVAETGLDSPGSVKLADFGLGLNVTDTLKQSVAYSVDETSSAGGGGVVGTLDYMAPEVRAGKPADRRADLYAAGVMLFEMLTGEPPAGTDVPSDEVPGVPAALDEVFRRSYVRLDRRYTSADEMLVALNEIAAHQRDGSPPPLPSPAPRRVVGSVAPPGDCPRCQGEVRGDDQFCMHCGQQLVQEVRRCGKCGAFPAAADTFCIFCGTDLRQPTPAPTPGRST